MLPNPPNSTLCNWRKMTKEKNGKKKRDVEIRDRKGERRVRQSERK